MINIHVGKHRLYVNTVDFGKPTRITITKAYRQITGVSLAESWNWSQQYIVPVSAIEDLVDFDLDSCLLGLRLEAETRNTREVHQRPMPNIGEEASDQMLGLYLPLNKRD